MWRKKYIVLLADVDVDIIVQLKCCCSLQEMENRNLWLTYKSMFKCCQVHTQTSPFHLSLRVLLKYISNFQFRTPYPFPPYCSEYYITPLKTPNLSDAVHWSIPKLNTGYATSLCVPSKLILFNSAEIHKSILKCLKFNQ